MSERTSWPFLEAQRILAANTGDGVITLQTGYGPSGTPHIGTFTEVARTTMVMTALRHLSDRPVRLIAYSDDMDGLRRVPDGVPNPEMMEQYIGVPLSLIPNPFPAENYQDYNTDSFSARNNAVLRSFLDQYGFEYDFRASSTEYSSTDFDRVLNELVENITEISRIVSSTMKEERRRSYCPLMPMINGRVVQDVYDWKVIRSDRMVPRTPARLRFYTEPSEVQGRQAHEIIIELGNVKPQWYVDWALRWCALGVDYEMHGKDLSDSARISSQICRALGYEPPVLFQYELFLDEHGKKISKSRGNGMDLSDWWRYSIPEVLSFYIFGNPRKSRKMYFDLIPHATEEYLRQIAVYNQDPSPDNPVWHVHSGTVPDRGLPVQFSMLLNLVSIANTEDPEMILNYIQTYLPDENLDDWPLIRPLIGVALNYYQDRVLPFKQYRAPTGEEILVLTQMANILEEIDHTEESVTAAIYDLGKATYGAENLRAYFGMVYEVLMGQSSGPRLPVFILLYGVENFSRMLKEVISQHV